MILYGLIVVVFISFNLGFFFTEPINKPKTIRTQIYAGLAVVGFSLLASVATLLVIQTIKGMS